MHLCSDAPKRTARACARPRGRVCRKNCVSRAAEEKSACTEPVVTTSQSVDREWQSGEKKYPRDIRRASRRHRVTSQSHVGTVGLAAGERRNSFGMRTRLRWTLTKIEEYGEAMRALKLETARLSAIVARTAMIPCNVRSERRKTITGMSEHTLGELSSST